MDERAADERAADERAAEDEVFPGVSGAGPRWQDGMPDGAPYSGTSYLPSSGVSRMSSDQIRQEAFGSAVALLTAVSCGPELLDQLVDEVCLHDSESLRVTVAVTVAQIGVGLGGRDAEVRMAAAIPSVVSELEERFGSSADVLLRQALVASLACSDGEVQVAYHALRACLCDEAPANLRFGSLYALSVLAAHWVDGDADRRAEGLRRLALAGLTA